MKLRRISILCFSLIVIFLILFPPKVYANGIIIPPDYSNTYSAILTFIGVFLITIVVELGVFYSFLRKSIVKYSLINKSVIAINTFTFPITQLTAIFFLIRSKFFIGQVFLIELIPITLECLLFLKIFIVLNKNDKVMRYQISKKKIILITVFANVLTFICGILIQIQLYF